MVQNSTNLSAMHSKQQNNTNYPSLLLNPSQNALVFSLLGKRCYTLATAVVQLVQTEPSSLSKWSLKTTGVVCFVKDHPKKSYFIKVYDCDTRTLTWQQEIYPSFEYRTPRPYFHTFEAHDCIVGLNFASEQEAQIFKETILGKLKDREKRRTNRIRHNGSTNHHNDSIKCSHSPHYGHNNNNNNIAETDHLKHVNGSHSHIPTLNNTNRQNGTNGSHHLDPNGNNQSRLTHTVSARLRPTQSGAAASIPVSTMQKSHSALLANYNNNQALLGNNAMKSEKKKLNKRDIGLPTNFQHVHHVGFSPQTGFDLENVNPSMKKDLQKLFDQQQQQQQQPQQHQQQPMNNRNQAYMQQHQAHQQQYIQQSQHHHQAPPPPPPPPPVPPMPSPAMLNKSRAQSSAGFQSTTSPSQPVTDRSLSNGSIALQPPAVPPPPPPPRPLPPAPTQANHKLRPNAQTNNHNIVPQDSKLKTNGVAAAIPVSGAPPPPPPPPPGGLAPLGAPISTKPIGGATAPKSNNSAPPPASSQLDMHAALMSQVLKGRQLNHVDPNAEKKSTHPSTSAPNIKEDPRTALMNQIKAGVKLKNVSSNQSKPLPVAQPVVAGGLAGALAKALQERSKVLQQTDESQSSSGNEEEDDDEWDES